MAGLKQRLAASAAALLIPAGAQTASAGGQTALQDLYAKNGSQDRVQQAVGYIAELKWPVIELAKQAQAGASGPAGIPPPLPACLMEVETVVNGPALAQSLNLARDLEKAGVPEFKGINRLIDADLGRALDQTGRPESQKFIAQRQRQMSQDGEGCIAVIKDAFENHGGPSQQAQATFRNTGAVRLVTANFNAVAASAFINHALKGDLLPAEVCKESVIPYVNSVWAAGMEQRDNAIGGLGSLLKDAGYKACGADDQGRITRPDSFMKPGTPGF